MLERSSPLYSLLVVALAQVCSGDLEKPYHDCPQYVAENTTLNCTCSTTLIDQLGVSLQWLGVSTTSRLTIENVSRKNNGTVLTCRMTQAGQTADANYTLQVAYGPFDSYTSVIASPSPLITNGSMALTLTCNATEVNPKPTYSWTVSCVNYVTGSNVCVFVPRVPADDGKKVACSAVSAFFDFKTPPKAAFGVTNLNLQYAPVTTPIISVNTSQSLTAGNNFTCTVSGGNPLVSRVLFSCYNLTSAAEVIMVDKADVVQQSSVSSQLTVPSSGPASVRCTCTAEWTPQPDFYRLSASVDLDLLYPPTTEPQIAGYKQGQAMVFGDTLSCTVFGGNPLVSQVTFSCFNAADQALANDVISDQNDTVGALSVSSPLVIPRTVTFNITCICRAVWPPRPELYTVTSSVTIPIQYPPSLQPVISGYTAGQALAPQSSLLCTVTGGQPLVSEVIFSCFNVSDLAQSSPVLSDQQDSVNFSLVSSSLTVPYLGMSQIICFCSAVWAPRRDLYTQNSTVTFDLQYSPRLSPVISGYTVGQTLMTGDSLTCTVTGGVPMVSRVTFSCFNVSDTSQTSAVIADQTDSVTTTAVSSRVVIPVSVTFNLNCVCNATWLPFPQAYTSKANMTVPIQYPPSQDPVISGYTDGQSLKAGDKLSCTVMGGNPLVSQVTFSCYNQSDVAYASAIIADQPDNTTQSAVTSSLTVPFTGLTGVVCSCSATWAPRSSLYTRTTRVSIALQYPPNTAPVISGYRGGHEVVTGDSLVCTVSGGKPIVSTVNFTCYSVTNPTVEAISDGPDTNRTTDVTSSVTFPSSVTSDVTCTCKAVWGPTPEFYQLIDTANVTVKYPPSRDPVITGYTPGQNLASGDSLTCSVTGGNPSVSQVIFSCLSLSNRSITVMADEPDKTQSGGMSSSLTVPSTAIPDAVCLCRAIWGPVPELYIRNTSITVSPNYPPNTAPVITGYGPGNTAITGDNLTCTVNGGKPLVSKVIFSCFASNDLTQSNPVVSDQADTTTSTSVVSSLIIPSQAANEVTCICRADWFPKPETYQLNVTVTIGIQYPPSSRPVISGYTQGQPMNAGSTLSCAVSGGKPLVSQVIFQCVDSANPANVVFRDQADAVVQSTVYSQLTVTSVGVYSVTCSCRALWAPRETLYVLNTSAEVVLQNPPPNPPVISGYTSGQQVGAGTTLTCTVAGGNPLVSRVTFSCYSPANDTVAVIPDKTDTVDQNSVSSGVTFPDLNLFNVTCVCTAVWSPRPETYTQSSSTTIQIQYPPPYPPQISSSRPGSDLVPGSFLSCTVIGGKPLASRVTFSCFNATGATQAVVLPDEPDTVSDNSVSSPLTVLDNSSSSITCTCSAIWAPKPSWYLTTASVTYSVQFVTAKAKIQSFTINNSPGTLTVNETDKRAATLVCAAQGRPVPTVTLSKTGRASFTSTTTVGPTASADISSVQCEHMGTYSCTADNGLSAPDQQAATLVVKCAPRLASGTTPSPTPPFLTSSGVTIVIMSYPPPNSFSYDYLGTTGSGAPATGSYSPFFNTSCTRAALTDPVVTCLVTANGEPGVSAGFYRLTMANTLGSFAFSFQVAQTGDDSSIIRDNTIAAIAGSVVAAFVLIFVIIILTVFFCMSRKHRNVLITSHSRITKDSTHETFSKRRLHTDASPGFYDVTNGVYIADGGMMETRPPPSSDGSISSSQRSRPISSGLFEYRDTAGFRESESKAFQESGYSTLSGNPSQKTANGSRAPSSNDDSDKRSIASVSNGKVRFALPSDDESDSSDHALYATVSKKTKPEPSTAKPITSSSKNELPLSTTQNGGANGAYHQNPVYSSSYKDDEPNRQRLHELLIKIEQPEPAKKSNLKQPANGYSR